MVSQKSKSAKKNIWMFQKQIMIKLSFAKKIFIQSSKARISIDDDVVECFL